MLASFPLLPSGGGGPSRGRVVFARRVREADAKLLEGLLGLAVALDLNPADASPNAPDRWIASASPDRLVAAGRIRDAGGRPWVGVRVTGPRPIHRQALATTWVVLGVVAVAGVLLGALQVVAVRKLLLARLIRLREEVAAIELEGDRLAPVTVDGDDELAAVAGGINAVFESARRARRALRESAQRRQEAERLELMGQLAGGVAHDLNNQLQVIRGSAELIEQDGTDPAFVQERAEAIVTTARESAEHVRRLLAFARKGNYRREEVPVDRLAGDLARLLTGTFEARIKVETDLGAAGAVVRGDPVQLQEALAGVAFNARDAMADDGVLRIATDREPPPVGPDRADAGWVHVAIADTGCGIAPEDLERVFEPYFTRKEGGTGLGLSACHGIVSNHGGVVTLESVVGEGTTVHIFLPVERGAAP